MTEILARTWVLIWEYSTRAIWWIPTQQGLDGFRKSLHPCALDESSLSIERVKLIAGRCYIGADPAP